MILSEGIMSSMADTLVVVAVVVAPDLATLDLIISICNQPTKYLGSSLVEKIHLHRFSMMTTISLVVVVLDKCKGCKWVVCIAKWEVEWAEEWVVNVSSPEVEVNKK